MNQKQSIADLKTQTQKPSLNPNSETESWTDLL